jgi:hypothetical protein
MSPRRFINALKSPSGLLVLFLVALAIVLFMINSRRDGSAAAEKASSNARRGEAAPQVRQNVEREIAPFNPPRANEKPASASPTKSAKPSNNAPALPPISLSAETPEPPKPEQKQFSPRFAPFGRLIPCELVITVDSSSINTPIVGLVTEDIFHHGQLVIPAGTEVHGTAQVDRVRERIASEGRWTLVWQNGEELSVSGLALDHQSDPETGTWDITDGSAGLKGRLIKTDNLAEVKLYAAALLSGAADVFTEKNTSAFGSFTVPSLQNAPLKGAQTVLDRYAQQILATIERDGFYVRVPSGKQFYLYVTQTVDEDDARIGGTQVKSIPPDQSAERSATLAQKAATNQAKPPLSAPAFRTSPASLSHSSIR